MKIKDTINKTAEFLNQNSSRKHNSLLFIIKWGFFSKTNVMKTILTCLWLYFDI